MLSVNGINHHIDEEKRYDDTEDDQDEFVEYDITSTPNDFNLSTIVSYIDAGIFTIPSFQRNYVWDIEHASKFIESLIRGLPVPQLFIYEESRNKFLVIDGHQRLLSIYYFFKQRFPRQEARPHLRAIFNEHGSIPEKVLNDNKYFDDFRLALSGSGTGKSNRFHRIDYDSLGEDKTRFDLRPLRIIVIKQNSSNDEYSAMYEIFNRLNSGGVNLRPQEIRQCLYYSKFYDMLEIINKEPIWRRFLRSDNPDLHMKDIEVLLRAFAILSDSKEYRPSLIKFLNQFSNKARGYTREHNQYLADLFKSFLNAAKHLNEDTFINKGNRRINVALIEAVFYATCRDGFAKRTLVEQHINADRIRELEIDKEFVDASTSNTTSRNNVTIRLRRGVEILGAP